jgi:hypothetical protein
MLSRSSWVAFGLFLGLILSFQTCFLSQAQSVDFQQDKYLPVSGVRLEKKNQLLVTQTKLVGISRESRLRIARIDSSLRRYWADSARLGSWYMPFFEAKGTEHALFRFRQPATDSMMSVVTDAQGRIKAVKRQLHSKDKSWNYSSLPHPNDGFILANPGVNDNSLWVRYLRPDLSEAWVWNLATTGGVLQLDTYAVNDKYLWLVVSDNATDLKRATSLAICLDVVAGRELTRISLDVSGKTHRFVSTCHIDSTGALLVAGQAFDVGRPRPDHNGDLFVQRLFSDGTRQPEQRAVLTGRELSSHLHWQSIIPQPNGGVRVVGEIYKSVIFLTLPLSFFSHTFSFVNHTTLLPQGVIVADLSPTGSLAQVRSLDVLDGAKFKIDGYWPARNMAVMATQAGYMQWRGLTPDAGAFLVRSPRRILRVGLDDWTQQTLATAGRKNALDIWGHTRGGALLLHEEIRRPKRVTRIFFAAP